MGTTAGRRGRRGVRPPVDPTIDRIAVADAPEEAPVQPRTQDARPAERTRRGRSAAVVVVAATPPTTPTGRARLIKRAAILAAVAVGVVVIAVAGFNLNGGTGIPPVDGTPQPAAAASPTIDTAKVADLMAKIKADPNDKVSYQSLADIYYLASDFESAGGFLEKVLAIDPKDVTARLALGAALYNLGKSDGAEAQWRQVLASEPDNLEAHYDLGFMFLSATPPDIANVKLEWGKVIQIAPDSDVAKTVATHLATLDASPAPSGPVGPSEAAPSVSPAPASPAPSAK